TALVTGAGGGLGQAIAVSLAGEGVNVVLADINLDAARRSAAVIEEKGGTALALEWDLADLGPAQEKLEQVKQRFGEVDILVNNTGGPPPTTAAGVPAV